MSDSDPLVTDPPQGTRIVQTPCWEVRCEGEIEPRGYVILASGKFWPYFFFPTTLENMGESFDNLSDAADAVFR